MTNDENEGATTMDIQEPSAPGSEQAKWSVQFKVEKYDGDWTPEQIAAGEADASLTEVFESKGNMLLNAGVQRLLDKLIGAAGQALDNTHARIGVGNGTTTAAAANTDLSAAAGAANRYFMTMDATFPSRSSQTLTFKATFGTGDGNFAWQEWGIDAGTAGGTTVTAPLLNRKVESMGTKSAGATWVHTATIVIS